YLEIDNLFSPEPFGNGVRLQLYFPGKPFGNGGFAHPGLSYEHDGVASFNMAEYFHYLLYLFVSADNGREFVKPREFVEIYGEVLEVGGEFVFLLVLLLRLFLAPH